MDLFLPNPRKPETDFAKERMRWIYDHCNMLYEAGDPPLSEDVRETLIAFFNRCGARRRWDRTIAGWNLGSLDRPFLFAKGMLAEEDIHYRMYEMGGCAELFHDAVQRDVNEGQISFALASIDGLGPHIPLPGVLMMPEGTTHTGEDLSHWGLYDCYAQLKKLNDFIAAFRHGVE